MNYLKLRSRRSRKKQSAVAVVVAQTLHSSRVRLSRVSLRPLVVFINRLWIYYFVKVNRHAKCPACGRRDVHKIEWSPVYEHVMHQHNTPEVGCGAIWGEKPLLSIELWRVTTPLGQAPIDEGMIERKDVTTNVRALSPEGKPIPARDGHTTTVVRQVN